VAPGAWQVGSAEDGFRPLAHHFRRAAAKSKMVGLRPEAGLGPPYNSLARAYGRAKDRLILAQPFCFRSAHPAIFHPLADHLIQPKILVRSMGISQITNGICSRTTADKMSARPEFAVELLISDH
jgi:hypothetical protein